MMRVVIFFQHLRVNRFYLEYEFEYWNPHEYVERMTYRSLKRAWIGFKVAKREGNRDKMKYYAEGIRKFERQLRLPVSAFSDILIENISKEKDLDRAKQKEESSEAINEL